MTSKEKQQMKAVVFDENKDINDADIIVSEHSLHTVKTMIAYSQTPICLMQTTKNGVIWYFVKFGNVYSIGMIDFDEALEVYDAIISISAKLHNHLFN